jgi:hypothetical protein
VASETLMLFAKPPVDCGPHNSDGRSAGASTWYTTVITQVSVSPSSNNSSVIEALDTPVDSNGAGPARQTQCLLMKLLVALRMRSIKT